MNTVFRPLSAILLLRILILFSISGLVFAESTSAPMSEQPAKSNVSDVDNKVDLDGQVLPFSEPVSKSVTGKTLATSKLAAFESTKHLPADAPNILIVLMDDVGFATADTFGGFVHTPTLSQLADAGISYNAFHNTSICSPTRAALLTGRNHTRVGSGTIAERAVNWDGYTGRIPKSSATIAEVLKQYGYRTAAFGKWHNTPVTETTAMGPFDRWPTGYGFEYFYGFLGGETSQYEPRLVENTNFIEPERRKDYHLTTDLTDKALVWLKKHRAYSPDAPFFMYYAPGAAHGPHHIFKEWADKYQGKFAKGWDVLRTETYQRQLQRGWIPQGTVLTSRPDSLAAWDSIPESQQAFQTRLMEVFSGFAEHADTEVGRLLAGMNDLGVVDNTLVIYLWGDNGSSSEGQQGTISELLAQNNIANTVDEQITALNKMGGLAELGSEKVDNMYHAGWAWAGSTPFKSTKLVAAHFGGTRSPVVVSWPKKITADKTIRNQFHHVTDVAPTIYQLLDITPPKVVNGYPQDPIDGTSFAYTFSDANAKTQKKEQFFDNNGSRGIYADGWFASTFGPLTPWQNAQTGLAQWNSEVDQWQLYDLSKDFSQSTDLSKQYPDKLVELQKRFDVLAKDNKDYPIGAGIWLRVHPEDRIKTPYNHWRFDDNVYRMPEFTAPGIGRESTQVTIDLQLNQQTNGVLYAVGGAGGGLSVYMQDNRLVYEYNMMVIENYRAESEPLTEGEHQLQITTDIEKPGGKGNVQIHDVSSAGEQLVLELELKRTVPAAFTATESFDVARDLGSSVSLHYAEHAPFDFTGKLSRLDIVTRPFTGIKAASDSIKPAEKPAN